MLRIFSFFSLLLMAVQLFGQQPVQTIRGTVTEEAVGFPLPYVSVMVRGTALGAVTDEKGNFVIKNVAIGRYNIAVTFVGYEPVILREIQVASSREVVLNIKMKEKITTLKEIIVRSKVNKEQSLNTMATVSARMLSVEEARRFAGGFDDPARLVSAFAGVTGNVGNNAIVVRGNSPQSLQWKMEGVEISNPNHFADLSAFGGGALTALSAQLLANSDFFSGAMPAEYSNALSGVFDIAMRSGNNQKHEHTFQLGAIGIDAASEGPFRKDGKASYIFNYRYSTLDLMAPVLPDEAAGTNYQDLSFKLNFPSGKTGTFSLWGIGLLDHSDAFAKQDIKNWEYDKDRENLHADQFMGAAGLSHHILLNRKQFLKTTIATTTNGIEMHTDRVDSTFNPFPKNKINSKYYNFVLNSFLNTRFSAKHTNKTGFVATNMHYSILLKDSKTGTSLKTLADEKGSSTLVSAFSSSMISLSDNIKLNLGLAGQWFTLNNSFSAEPRAGISYRFAHSQNLSFAYGLHSRLERLNYYFVKDSLTRTSLNKDLGFTKAHHFVLGYGLSTSEFTHLKVELYYQHLYHVPVKPGTSFSLINQQNDWFFDGKLENSGKGRNYGLELTFEKYLSRGYYYLATASLFSSRYRGADGLWRDSRYNRNFALNYLIGKEWQLGKNQNKILSLNARISFQGGDHYTPANRELSVARRKVVFDETKAFSLQYPPAFTSHFTASYKINKKKIAHEFALMIINLTQYKEYLGFHYNYHTQTVDDDREATFVPNVSYKIEF